jgi:hypothetical protein
MAHAMQSNTTKTIQPIDFTPANTTSAIEMRVETTRRADA